jgi:hypothetical protein
MNKKLLSVDECVFVGGVFDGQWIGLNEVQIEEVFMKPILPHINKFITEKICTFYYKGNKHTSAVAKKPNWVFI